MILLTGKELSELQLYQEPDNESIGYEKNIAKAQAKKILNWGKETCPHSQVKTRKPHKRQCSVCWQELERAIEG